MSQHTEHFFVNIILRTFVINFNEEFENNNLKYDKMIK